MARPAPRRFSVCRYWFITASMAATVTGPWLRSVRGSVSSRDVNSAAMRAFAPEPRADTCRGIRPARVCLSNSAWYCAGVIAPRATHGPMVEST